MGDTIVHGRPGALRHDLSWAVAVLVCSIALHAWIPALYPIAPVSDFRSVVDFATLMAQEGVAVPGWYWDLLSPGTPTLLSVPLSFFGGKPDDVARVATVIVVSLVPVMPMLLLRGVAPLWGRLLAAALMMFSPAQMVFSGVVAQDNWVQLPVVALACLAIRNWYGHGRGYPAWSALLWVLSLFMRQEMLLVTLPLLALSAWSWRSVWSPRRITLFVAIAAGGLALVAAQRHAATGEFSLTSRHGGASLLGSYVPGAGFGWIDYSDFVAKRAPEMAGEPSQVRENAGRMAIDEIAARPVFHLLRRLGAIVHTTTARDDSLQTWALTFPDATKAVFSPAQAESAGRLAQRLSNPIVLYAAALHIMFLAAVYVGLRRRDAAIVALSLAIVLKVGIHFVVAVQARFFLVIYALEALTIALAVVHLHGHRSLARGTGLVVAGSTVLVSIALLGLNHLAAWVATRDAMYEQALMRDYRPRVMGANVVCQLVSGRVMRLADDGYAFSVLRADPEPDEFAELSCKISPESADAAPLRLEVEDGYTPGGFPDRMLQIVFVDGREVRRHDIAAEAGAGWWSYELPLTQGPLDVRIRVEAVRPDTGPGWGNAAETAIRFVPAR